MKFISAALPLLATLSGASTDAEINEFLAKKKAEPGFYELPIPGGKPSLVFKVLRKGEEGRGRPKVGTTCGCHYHGTVPLNGDQTFDSSYDRGEPTEFAPNQVIAGWTEAMQQMHIGEKWEMYLHPEIAYGSRAMGQVIKANSLLKFVMEIKYCNGPVDKTARTLTADYAPGWEESEEGQKHINAKDPLPPHEEYLSETVAKIEGINILPVPSRGGEDVPLYFRVLKKGDPSKGRPFAGTACKCHYAGTLPMAGDEEFDSSYSRGEPTEFAPNQVIPGWTSAMQEMYIGEKWEMYLHPNIAYGPRGTGPIPPNSVLKFIMEIVSCGKNVNMDPRKVDYPVDEKRAKELAEKDAGVAGMDDGEGTPQEKWLAKKAEEKGVHKLAVTNSRTGQTRDLLFKVLQKGDQSKGRPFENTPCYCHYTGTLPMNGDKKFDSSRDRGSPTKFAPNQVIPGWTGAMQEMYVGDRWQMWIHPDIAYGPRGQGPIGPNSVLEFDMEIMSCEGNVNTAPRGQDYAKHDEL